MEFNLHDHAQILDLLQLLAHIHQPNGAFELNFPEGDDDVNAANDDEQDDEDDMDDIGDIDDMEDGDGAEGEAEGDGEEDQDMEAPEGDVQDQE